MKSPPQPVSTAPFSAYFVRNGPVLTVAVFLLIAFLHGAQTLSLLPWSDFRANQPVMTGDHGNALGLIRRDREFSALGRSWGYDPRVMGGVRIGAGISADTNAAIAFDRLVRRGLPPAQSYRLFLFLVILTGPLLMYPACRWIGLDRAAALVGTSLAVLGTDHYLHHSGALLRSGQVAFWGGAFLSLAVVAALVRSSSKGGRAVIVGGIPLVALLDPALVLVVGAGALARALRSRDRERRALRVPLALAAAGTLLLNGWWMAGMSRFWSDFFPASGWSTTVLDDGINAFLFPGLYVSLATVLRLYLFLCAALEIVRAGAHRGSPWVDVVSAAAAAALIGFAGSSLPLIGHLQPARFVFVFFVFLIPPAASFLSAAFLRPGTRREMFFLLGLWFLVTAHLAFQKGRPLDARKSPVGTQFRSDVARLPTGARILVETDPDLASDTQMLAFLPGRSFVGFPVGRFESRTGFDTFFGRATAGMLFFGRELASLPPDDAATLLNHYNVRWVVAVSPEIQSYFDFYEDTFRPVVEWPRRETRAPGQRHRYAYRIFETPVAPSYVEKGKGSVRFDLNRIFVDGMSAGQVVIRSHYDPMFQSAAGRVSPAYVTTETRPFLSIDNRDGADPAVLFFGARRAPMMDGR